MMRDQRRAIGIILAAGWVGLAGLNLMVMLGGYHHGVSVAAILIALTMAYLEMWDRWR